MKKVFITILATAISLSAFAQILASNNQFDIDNNMYAVYNFDGTAYDNYGTVVQNVADALCPSSQLNGASYTDYSFSNGELVINKNSPTPTPTESFAWHKAVILFGSKAEANGKDYGQKNTIDLSTMSNHYFKININSSVAVPQCVVFLYANGAYADNNLVVNQPLVVGDNEIIVHGSKFDFRQYAGGGSYTTALDSNQIEGVGISFRTSYDNNAPLVGTFKISYMAIGDINKADVDYTFAKSNSVVFPNPIASNDELNVKGLSGSVSMKLLNATGSTVAFSESAKLSLSNVNAGLYFLEVNNNGTIRTEKVMVK